MSDSDRTYLSIVIHQHASENGFRYAWHSFVGRKPICWNRCRSKMLLNVRSKVEWDEYFKGVVIDCAIRLQNNRCTLRFIRALQSIVHFQEPISSKCKRARYVAIVASSRIILFFFGFADGIRSFRTRKKQANQPYCGPYTCKNFREFYFFEKVLRFFF